MVQQNGSDLVFDFPHLAGGCDFRLDFQRTLRIPDDGKQYPLPPGLGKFPMKEIDRLAPEYRQRIPSAWAEKGGVLLPMFNSEALWLRFTPVSAWALDRQGDRIPFAVKVASGLRSAVTGRPRAQGLREKDYLVCPPQPWLDGFKTESGVIRQFIAMPLSSGTTVEEQLSGEAKFGGIQIEVLPPKKAWFDGRFQKLPKREEKTGGGILRSRMSAAAAAGSSGSLGGLYSTAYACNSAGPAGGATMDYMVQEMHRSVEALGLSGGGRMTQEIYDDPHGLDTWDLEQKQRIFVHLVPAGAWAYLTGEPLPTRPLSASDYQAAHLPWFEHYSNGKVLAATNELAGIHSVAEMNPDLLPENQSVDLSKKLIQATYTPGASSVTYTGIRDGKW